MLGAKEKGGPEGPPKEFNINLGLGRAEESTKVYRGLTSTRDRFDAVQSTVNGHVQIIKMSFGVRISLTLHGPSQTAFQPL